MENKRVKVFGHEESKYDIIFTLFWQDQTLQVKAREIIF